MGQSLKEALALLHDIQGGKKGMCALNAALFPIHLIDFRLRDTMKTTMVLATMGTLAAACGIFTSSAEAAPARGSNCVDMKVQISCAGNVISGVGTVTNCSSRADTFLVSAKTIDPSGDVAVNESLTVPLGGNKSFSLPLNEEIWSGIEAGTYTTTIIADAEKGTAYKSYTFTLTLPCP